MKVALCCIGKLENRYILEFIEHYNKLGFDKIFLYDNNDVDDEHFEDVIQDYVDNDFVEIIDYRGKKICQLSAYQDCYDNHNQEYEWIAFFDCDEFLVISKTNIHDYLSQNIFNDYQMIHINWLVYGDNNLVRYEDKPLQERFNTFKMPISYLNRMGFANNFHVKSIIRGNQEVKWESTPHTPISECKCCNGIGIECDGNIPIMPFNFDGAFLKHFSTKTIEEWIDIKQKRGFPDQTEEQIATFTAIDMFFNENEITDEKLELIKSKGIVYEKAKRYTVLTYITNNYEEPREILEKDNDAEYVLVTDNPTLTSNTWTVVYDESLTKISDPFDRCLEIRYNCFKYCKTDICLKIDGSIEVTKSLKPIIDKFEADNYDASFMIHPERNTFPEEYQAWVDIKGYDSPHANYCLTVMNNGGYNYQYKGLFQTGFSIQRRGKLANDINRMTLSYLKYLGDVHHMERLDQIPFSYIMNKYFNMSKIMPVGEELITNSPYLKLYIHKTNKTIPFKEEAIKPYMFNKEVETIKFN